MHDYSFASDNYFDEFGKVDRTITFAMQPDSGDGIRLRFSNESPWAQKRGAHDQSEGMTYWPAFDLPFPATDSDISGRPASTHRSKFLIPLLPEPMRSHFEALERTVEELRSSQKN